MLHSICIQYYLLKYLLTAHMPHIYDFHNLYISMHFINGKQGEAGCTSCYSLANLFCETLINCSRTNIW